jgi:hypothetical protein
MASVRVLPSPLRWRYLSVATEVRVSSARGISDRESKPISIAEAALSAGKT